MNNTRIEFNTMQIMADIKKRVGIAQRALDIQVLKDSNFYCPDDEGTLKASSLQSIPGTGVVSWNTPYAAKQYYEAPNKSLDKNPNARMKWFEEAKSAKKKDWEVLANAEYHK